MSSLDPSHIPRFTAREKHTGNPTAVQARTHSGSGSDPTKHVVVIPDLRFERSYLKSIAPYVRTRRVSDGAAGGSEVREVVDIKWNKVLWITVRDQLVSPLLQGAIWGIAQLFVRPLVANIRAFFGSSKAVSSVDSATNKPPKSRNRGELTRRLREWSKTLKEG